MNCCQLLKGFCLFLLLSTGETALGQEFGGNPPAIRWRQLNSDTVRVLFPSGMESQAAAIAGLAGRLGKTQYTLGSRFRKISIVLQNQTTLSNGYVGLAPRRSEFQLTPLQNSFALGSLPWHQQLTLHEFRHVQQFNHFRQGLVPNLFYGLAGQSGLSLIYNAAVPNWFWEGDAVYQETAQSPQGRGRLPGFFNGYRSLWAAGKQYSWMKLRNGSLRDYVPDHYQLGYLLVAYGRERFGAETWGKISADAVRFKGIFFPFQRAVRKATGISYTQFTKEAFHYFQEQLPIGKDSFAAAQKQFAGNEEYPHWVSAQQLLLIKTDYRKLPRFVLRRLDTGTDSLIRVRDISADRYFSYRNGRLVYAALGYNPRWGWRNYSELRIIELKTGNQKTITRHSKYFAPDISADGRQVVAVEVLPSGSSARHVLDAGTGKLISAVPNPHRFFFTQPKFFGPETIVAAVRNAAGQMALGLFPIAGNRPVEWILPFSYQVIGFPQVNADSICFTASTGKLDRTYLWSKGKLYLFNPSGQEQDSHYQLVKGEGGWAWTRFTAAGYRIGTQTHASLSLTDWKTITRPLSNFGVTQLGQAPIDTGLDSNINVYPIKRYRAFAQLFNIHSWIPTFSDPEYRLSFYSDNLLNTLQAEFYSEYNSNEKSTTLGATAVYAAWYPQLRLGSNYTFHRVGAIYNGKRVNINLWEARAGLSIPLNLTKGRWFRYFNATADYVYAKPMLIGEFKDSFRIRDYDYLHGIIGFSNLSQRAVQDIYPRWAQDIRLNYYRSVERSRVYQLLASGNFYLPGLRLGHSVVVQGSWQRKDTLEELAFTNSFAFSRGYLENRFPVSFLPRTQWKLGINYHLPLAYPDWGIANLVYFIRLRANLYFDYTRAAGFMRSDLSPQQLNYRSGGAELFFDTQWWNQHRISFGFRYSYLLDAAQQKIPAHQWEFVLPVNLAGR